MTGPFDGQLKTYYFGHRHDQDNFHGWEVEAFSLDRAILRFRAGCLFPFRYAPRKYWVIREGVEWNGRSVYDEIDIVGAKSGAKIKVYVIDEGKERTVAIIPVETDEPIMDPRVLLPPQAVTVFDEATTAIELSVQPPALRGLQAADRKEVTRRTMELEQAIRGLELQRREMEMQVAKLRAEIDERMKKIWLIELYIGSKEEVTQLASGVPAPANEPITVRQQTLCMDEEIAVWAWRHQPELLDGETGFDYRNIDDFDRWLTEAPAHLDQVFPERKGIVAIRVRRREKKYATDGGIGSAMAAVAQNDANRRTYLLVRNGENLYRLWIDAVIWPRFFPRKDEMDFAARMEKDHFFDAKKAKEEVEHYVRGLVVLQGLLDRSTLFQPHPTSEKINVFDPADIERYLRLVRDDEPALVADTSILSWYDYQKWLKGQVRVGARVIFRRLRESGYGRDYDPLYEATGIKSVQAFPVSGALYVVDMERERRYHGQKFSFLYLPDDEVAKDATWYRANEWGPRTKKVRYWFFEDEVVPFDAISPRYLDYLIHDRSQREHYVDSFMMLWHWYRRRREEEAAEAPFVDLVLRQAGMDPWDPTNEREKVRCRRLVRWWKLKTKAGRSLGADEPKALRMVVAAFKRGQDFDDDPERGLPDVDDRGRVRVDETKRDKEGE